MRLYPPAFMIGREPREEFELGRLSDPPGTAIFMSQYVTQRDGRFFERPEAFEPERWAAERTAAIPKMAYFPFGAGPRVCIGNSFAMLESVLVLATIARRWSLDVVEDQTIRLAPLFTLRRALRNSGDRAQSGDATRPAHRAIRNRQRRVDAHAPLWSVANRVEMMSHEDDTTGHDASSANLERLRETVSDDVHLLNSLGYTQELLRRMSGFSNFAISLSIICILSGGITSFPDGFCSVGGAAIGLGWPLCCLISLCVALAMAQLPRPFRPLAASIIGRPFWEGAAGVG